MSLLPVLFLFSLPRDCCNEFHLSLIGLLCIWVLVFPSLFQSVHLFCFPHVSPPSSALFPVSLCCFSCFFLFFFWDSRLHSPSFWFSLLLVVVFLFGFPPAYFWQLLLLVFWTLVFYRYSSLRPGLCYVTCLPQCAWRLGTFLMSDQTIRPKYPPISGLSRSL